MSAELLVPHSNIKCVQPESMSIKITRTVGNETEVIVDEENQGENPATVVVMFDLSEIPNLSKHTDEKNPVYEKKNLHILVMAELPVGDGEKEQIRCEFDPCNVTITASNTYALNKEVSYTQKAESESDKPKAGAKKKTTGFGKKGLKMQKEVNQPKASSTEVKVEFNIVIVTDDLIFYRILKRSGATMK